MRLSPGDGMSRRVLRSWKCKAGAHQGSPKTLVVPSGKLPSSWEDTVLRETTGGSEYVGVLTIIAAQCRWHGCRCYCHPWFLKRPGLRFKGGSQAKVMMKV